MYVLLHGIFVPYYSEGPSMISYLAVTSEVLSQSGQRAMYDTFDIVAHPKFATGVIELGSCVSELPKALASYSLLGVAVVKTDSPLTRATDGDYKADRHRFHVETTMHYGAPTQYLHVFALFDPLNKTADFDGLTEYLYDLMNGTLNGSCRNGVHFPNILTQ
jgi:hypothetical protein